ncbi:MAG TPA: acyl-CoA dehydrogenase family protein [Pyrinomonadaceae bacterium]|nr:acyl-CoA dehydrogenase family protein [Chloracidobacterium sp.]HQX54747.1 acyl-CoA dehydrogenase family protein [Pyrinomonadaceae bacterium]MBK7802141.1 acyl-CoA dehydrogenase family protein [Chloracidobacterium sp.]MBK9437713.1 acyl-CoA dehydrogenase family protein [Chloracidobacterium sp.]MBL0239688.1 acyl-CoA dehydrogenase family protein [Chloracidobacterium sp.]
MEREYVKGGEFLIADSNTAGVFTPEDFTDEHRMIGETCKEYIDNEVAPNIDALEKHEWNIARDLLKKAGDLGLLGANIPEELGGMALDQTSGVIIAEMVGRGGGFGSTYGAQTSIGLLPILYWGSDELKNEWIPKIISGEAVSAYCLTESSSGSDALGAKCVAKLSDDGQTWTLNGEKMWITNGGFADVFLVFAKVDGEKEKFSCFLVPQSESCRAGAEEHKLGIKSSSTTAVILSDCKIPAGNLIGNVGDGAKIAFNVLNVGRFKLGASVTGGAKLAIHEAVRYANERHQFNKPISSFGAIKHKLAEMAIRTWVSEAITYRTVGMIDHLIGDGADNATKLQSIEEYAVESSINKVACSESLDYVVDEMVQIYGGYGYSADYPAEKAYRDSRINRIFEGTNEINRMLIPGQLMKRAIKGRLGLLQAAKALMDEILNPQMSFDEDTSLLAAETKLAQNAKKIALMTLGTAAQKYMMELSEQQEVLINCADIIMDAYQMETAILRAKKFAEKNGEESAGRYIDMASVFCNDAIQRIDAKAKNTIAAIAEGDEGRTLLVALKRFTKNNSPVNTIAARQRIADTMIQANTYVY